MRHKRIQSTKRHKKIKVFEGPSKHNVVKDKILMKNKEQGMPKKLQEMLTLKGEIHRLNAECSKKKKKVKSDKTAQAGNKEAAELKIEPGMTRMPTAVPDKLERREFETDKSYMNRIQKMVAKAMNDANIEQHFDVDLRGSVQDNGLSKKNHSKNHSKMELSEEDLRIQTVDPKKAKKLEEKKLERIEKKREKNLLRKERKLKRKRRLIQLIQNDDSGSSALFKKDAIAFGERVDQPPELKPWKKRGI